MVGKLVISLGMYMLSLCAYRLHLFLLISNRGLLTINNQRMVNESVRFDSAMHRVLHIGKLKKF